MDTTNIIEKLIQLAVKNPNKEEAAAAAMKAVQLLDKFQIPIGANMSIRLDDNKPWVPPEPEFINIVDEIINGRSKNPDATGPQDRGSVGGGPGYEGGIRVQDREVDTAQDAWRKRMVDAWRAIKEERRKLVGEVHRYEQKYRERYQWNDIRNSQS